MRRAAWIALASTLPARWLEPAAAATLTLAPGAPTAPLVASALPGDEIVLAPGRHVSLDFSALHGASDRPIIVRGAAPSQPAMVEGGAFAIRLDGARHVVVQDVACRGGSQAAILAENGGSEDIVLRRVIVVRTDGTSSDSVRLVGAIGLRIENCHLERAGAPDGAGLRLRDCAGVGVADTRFVGAIPAQGAAIAIEGRSRDILVGRCRVEGGVRIGVLIRGSTPSDGAASAADATAPASRRPRPRMAHLRAPRAWPMSSCRAASSPQCAAAWSIDRADDVLIEQRTVSEPDGVAFVVSARCRCGSHRSSSAAISSTGCPTSFGASRTRRPTCLPGRCGSTRTCGGPPTCPRRSRSTARFRETWRRRRS
ncbi:MAG: hypothetical protein U0575_01545 [Phycisphaerales bacterium]